MNHEHDEDLRKARLYLTLDADEMANVRAEHEKYERRKQAMQRGDQGSPIPNTSECECGPLTFTPIPCSTCGVKLTTMNHSASLTCHDCVAHEERIRFNAEANARLLIAQAKVVAGQKRETRRYLMFAMVLAVAGGVALAWFLNVVFFAVGSAL